MEHEEIACDSVIWYLAYVDAYDDVCHGVGSHDVGAILCGGVIEGSVV